MDFSFGARPWGAGILIAILVSSIFLPSIWNDDQEAHAATPAGFSDRLVAGGLELPTAMKFASDGRMFVSEKEGNLRVIKDGILLAEPFVSISVNSQGERGLMGDCF